MVASTPNHHHASPSPGSCAKVRLAASSSVLSRTSFGAWSSVDDIVSSSFPHAPHRSVRTQCNKTWETVLLPRIPIPRTRVNKGEVGGSGPLSPAPTYTLPQQERHQEGNDDERNPDCTSPRPRARRHSLTL